MKWEFDNFQLNEMNFVFIFNWRNPSHHIMIPTPASAPSLGDTSGRECIFHEDLVFYWFQKVRTYIRIIGDSRIEDKKVSWFLGFLVFGVWFLGFWLLGFLVSKLLRLTKIHLVLFGRYWFHTQDFQYFIRRIFGICQCPSFQKLSNNGFPKLRFTSIIFSKCSREFSWLLLGILVFPKIKIVGFGESGHVQKFRNHRNEGLGFLP